jgi:hypothetical protein
METHPDTPRGLYLRLQEVPGPTREHVMVVHRGRAAGAGQGAEPGAGSGPFYLLVHERPNRVQLDQPLEERRLLRQPARRPLVQVVVAVDQAGGGEAAAAVYSPSVRLCLLRRGAVADGDDAVPLDDDVAGGVLGARAVDGGDGAVFDDEARLAHAPLLSDARWTASRIFS